tara:strand:- start:39 stop:338 length:300 start_codon:yes stop_codon:yes gene_type:complete
MADPVSVATVVAAVASTAVSIKSLTSSPPSGQGGGGSGIPRAPTFDDAAIEADKMKETRLKKGRLYSVKNTGGSGGLTQKATLSTPGLVSDESKMLLGA